jgi:alkylation response protein AidB-like acyl-CoA dehydrogenase
VRELRHITGEVDFCEVFLDGARVPDFNRLGDVGDGWRVANATLSGERQMVAGAGSGGVDRIGGSGVSRLIRLAREISAQGREGAWDDPEVRNDLMKLYSEERIRSYTNQRVRAMLKSGRPPGPESSIGKVHGASLNMRVQLMATDLLGAHATAWESEHAGEAGPVAYAESLPYEVQGMLRSRANSIEGGTTEVNKNILGERVLGLPREPDQFRRSAWRDVPRS